MGERLFRRGEVVGAVDYYARSVFHLVIKVYFQNDRNTKLMKASKIPPKSY